MASSKPRVPRHTELSYDLIDVLDAVSDKSPSDAADYAGYLLGMTAKDWPGAAARVFGKVEAATLCAVHTVGMAMAQKAAASQAEARIAQAEAQLSAEDGDDDVADLLAALVALGRDARAQLRKQLAVTTSAPGGTTVASSGEQSAVTTKSGDFLATVLQGNLQSDMIPR